jgi:hypothetical protein
LQRTAGPYIGVKLSHRTPLSIGQVRRRQQTYPSALIKTKERPANDQEKDPMARRETLEFVRAYYKITDPAVRKRVFELTKAVAKGGE